MSNIKYYIANSTGKFDSLTTKIISAFGKAEKIATDKLKANQIDIIFVNAPGDTIPGTGVGGFSPGPHNVYVSIDPDFKDLAEEDLVLTMLHEMHHCMRWRNPGYGKTLGEAMITEGLASLFEEEISGAKPAYVNVTLKESDLEKAKSYMNDDTYDHSEWFFGTKGIDKWFGYTYGYKLAKTYSEMTGKKASALCHTKASLIIS